MDPLMTFWIFLIGIIVGVIIAITLIHKAAVYPLHKKIEKLTSENKTLQSSLDNRKEKLAVYKSKYPYSIENFRFIGTPIDGIQFENDQILFIKLKSGVAKLTTKQNKIKKLIKEGKVHWFEFKI